MSIDGSVFLRAGKHEVLGHSFVLARDVYVGNCPMPDDFAEIDGEPVRLEIGDQMPYWLSDYLFGYGDVVG